MGSTLKVPHRFGASMSKKKSSQVVFNGELVINKDSEILQRNFDQLHSPEASTSKEEKKHPEQIKEENEAMDLVHQNSTDLTSYQRKQRMSLVLLEKKPEVEEEWDSRYDEPHEDSKLTREELIKNVNLIMKQDKRGETFSDEDQEEAFFEQTRADKDI
mmetsp:Transcript_30224/g.46210  ORF Transcript_30224/g.46210 Transcript_30224/m.46210 type:complete len:159 (-) Transcript_30224:899-1375(-)